MNNTTEIILLKDLQKIPISYTFMEVLVALCAIVGNLLVMVAFLVEKRLRRYPNYYILSLSVADFFVGLIGIPSAILIKIGYPKDSFLSCLTLLSVLIVLCTVSIFNLLAVSLDRYWAILHPVKYHKYMSGKIAAFIIISCWILGSLIGFLPLFGWNNGPGEKRRCVFKPTIDDSFLAFLFFATVVFSGLLLGYFYSRIYCVILRKIRRKAHKNASSGNPNLDDKYRGLISIFSSLNKEEVSKAKNISAIVLFFVICWFPISTLNCISTFCKRCNSSLPLTDIFTVFSHVNSAASPLLYAYQMPDFRRAINRLLRCGR